MNQITKRSPFAPAILIASIAMTVAMIMWMLPNILQLAKAYEAYRDTSLVFSILKFAFFLFAGISLAVCIPKMNAFSMKNKGMKLASVGTILFAIVGLVFVAIWSSVSISSVTVYIILDCLTALLTATLMIIIAIGFASLAKHFKAGAGIISAAFWILTVLAIVSLALDLIAELISYYSPFLETIYKIYEIMPIAWIVGAAIALLGIWIMCANAASKPATPCLNASNLNPAATPSAASAPAAAPKTVPEPAAAPIKAPVSSTPSYQTPAPKAAPTPAAAAPTHATPTPAPTRIAEPKEAPATATGEFRPLSDEQIKMLYAMDNKSLQAIVDNPSLYANPAIVAEASKILTLRS